MRTLMRLSVAAAFLVGAAGSCTTAYLVGYAHGLKVHAKTTELPPMQLDTLQPVELSTPVMN